MALKALMLRKKLNDANKALEALRAKTAEFEQRQAELEKSIEEAETEEERSAVEEAIDTYEADKAAHDAELESLEGQVRQIEADLEAEEKAQDTTPPAGGAPEEERKDGHKMTNRMKFFGMNAQERDAFVAREDVKGFLTEDRTAIKEKRAITGAGLLIPDVMLGLLRENIAQYSKLYKYVFVRQVPGTGRMAIEGSIPEAVWTEMCANLNELDLGFNQVEVDGYKVGGFIAICNAALDDSDIALASEIIIAIGGAIGKALDKAILFGTGIKMPIGIATRLAQESQPASWGAYAPAWTDLHSTNILSLNINSTRGAEFFESLIGALGVAKPKYSSDGLFWVMNRKTHLKIMAKALQFDSSAALVSNTSLMPIIGGDVVEFEDSEIQDNTIYGGFGGNYLLAERQGVEFASSDIPRFLQDQTVFKGTARYDGMPVAGEAFVIANFANTSPTKTADFAPDWANTDLSELTISAAASASNAGKTVLTVTDYLADESPVLYYKLGTQKVEAGEVIAVSGTGAWSSLTSGTTEITAAAGKKITVVELNAAAASGGVVVSAGVVASVPKAAG